MPIKALNDKQDIIQSIYEPHDIRAHLSKYWRARAKDHWNVPKMCFSSLFTHFIKNKSFSGGAHHRVRTRVTCAPPHNFSPWYFECFYSFSLPRAHTENNHATEKVINTWSISKKIENCSESLQGAKIYMVLAITPTWKAIGTKWIVGLWFQGYCDLY